MKILSDRLDIAIGFSLFPRPGISPAASLILTAASHRPLFKASPDMPECGQRAKPQGSAPGTVHPSMCLRIRDSP